MRNQIKDDVWESTKGGIPQYRLTHEERMDLVGINPSLAEDIYEGRVRDPEFMRKDPNATYSRSMDVE